MTTRAAKLYHTQSSYETIQLTMDVRLIKQTGREFVVQHSPYSGVNAGSID
jgi:hypothetical protein